MKFVFLMGAFLLAGVCAAAADGYGDFNAGIAAADRDESADAIASLSKALAAPDLPQHLHAVAYLVRGQQYGEAGQYDASIADLTAALKLKPNYIEALVSRCAAYAVKQQFSQAEADCSAAVALDPANWRLRRLRISLYEVDNKYDAAIADYSSFTAKRPNDAWLLLGRTNALRMAGRYDEALADAKALHDAHKDWAEPYVAIAQVLAAQNKLPDALDNMDSAIDEDSRNPDLRLINGQLEWLAGRSDHAADSFEDTFRHDNVDLPGFLWLSITKAELKKSLSRDIVSRVSSADLSGWPGPLVQLYLGRKTPADVLTVAAKDASPLNDQQCEADFYVGEWQQLQGNALEAKRLLNLATGSCTDLARQLAVAALARVSQAPAP